MTRIYGDKLSESDVAAIIMDADAKVTLAQLATYFKNIYKNYEFSGFEDKKFHDYIKDLIKNPDELWYYMKLLDMDVKYFFKLLSYIVPDIFTHNIIKLVRVNYLNISPKVKK